MSRELPARATNTSRHKSRTLPQALLASVRPKQWTKNLLLFLALIFARTLTDPSLVLLAGLAFVDFCLLAGATYLVNDLVDLEQDREHPIKRFRPIASGQLPPSVAAAASLALFAPGIALAWAVGTPFLLMAMLYVVLTLSYSFGLKHMVIMDVLAVAAGFVIRAAAGAVAISVPISPWLYVVTILGALFIAISKRRHELLLLQGNAANHRKILEEYSVPLLDQMISVVTSATVIAYSLYTFSAENLPKNHAMMLTIPFLLYGIFRYLYLTHMKDVGGSPEEVLIADRPLLVTILGWGLVSTAILYLAPPA